MTYAPPTETNPPFNNPTTWPFPTTSERWETDYRLRLLEYALTYMWGNATNYNLVKNFGGDPTGVNTSSPAFTQAIQSAIAVGGLTEIYMPEGVFSVPTTVKSSPTSTVQGNLQSTVIRFRGAGPYRTVIKGPWLGISDLFQVYGIPIIVEDCTIDQNMGSGEGFYCANQFINQSSIGGCSAPGGGLIITLGSQVGAAALPPGSIVCVPNSASATGSAPYFYGTTASYNVNGGGAGIDTVSVNPNGLYPTVLAFNARMFTGSGINPVPFIKARRVTFRNRGPSWSSLNITGAASGSITLTWSGNQFTLNYGMNAQQIQAAVNASINPPLPTGSGNPFQLLVFTTGTGTLGAGLTVYFMGLLQGFQVAVAADNILPASHTTTVVSRTANGRPIIVTDTSTPNPFIIGDFQVDDAIFENDHGDINECLSGIAVKRTDFKNMRYVNTYGARGSMTAGSTTLNMDGVLTSPPQPGAPIGVAGAGGAYGNLLSQTASILLITPNILRFAGAVSAADGAALIPGSTISIPGAGPAAATLVTTITAVQTISAVTYVWIANAATTAVAGVTASLTASVLLTTVALPGPIVVNNANGAPITQIPLTLPAVVGVFQALVGVGGGRSVVDVFAVDHAEITGLKHTVGCFQTTDFASFTNNFGAISECNCRGFSIEDPFQVAGANASVIIDSVNLRADDWDIPPTVRILISRWHPTGQRATFVNCKAPGFNVSNTPISTQIIGGLWSLGCYVGAIGIFNKNNSGDSGALYISGGADIEAGTGAVCGSYTGGAAATFNLQWSGGNGVAGGIFASLPGGTRATLNPASAIRGVTGINPRGATAIGTAFALPASGAPWTNTTGTEVTLAITAGALTNVQVEGVVQGLNGPWRVQPGGTWTPTYSAAPTITATYE